MAVNRMEGRPAPEGGAGQAKPAAEEAAKPAAKPAGGGGMGAWMPVAVNLLLMPVLAYVMTAYVLVPKLSTTVGGKLAGEHASEAAPASGEGHGGGGHGSGEKGKGEGSHAKQIVPLSSKVLVNLSGTMGTRYLLANISLVGKGSDFKERVAGNDIQLRDAAAGILHTKTIPDLERPGARNMIRSELISVFNNVLGENSVQELYLTEFAIQ